MFYGRIFSYKILVPKITKLCFGFEIFWRKNIGAKCAQKMLMKLTQGCKFLNYIAKKVQPCV